MSAVIELLPNGPELKVILGDRVTVHQKAEITASLHLEANPPQSDSVGLERLVRGYQAIAIDGHQLHEIDSTGLAILDAICRAAKAQNEGFYLTEPSDRFRRILFACGSIHIFDNYHVFANEARLTGRI